MMTKEELREHCEKQIRHCEIFAHERGVVPSGNIYEEHKLILELLEQVSILDKIRAEIIELRHKQNVGVLECLDIIDKYKAEMEE